MRKHNEQLIHEKVIRDKKSPQCKSTILTFFPQLSVNYAFGLAKLTPLPLPCLSQLVYELFSSCLKNTQDN
jgi:hypothetical protein